jgi:hypothetical protein
MGKREDEIYIHHPGLPLDINIDQENEKPHSQSSIITSKKLTSKSQLLNPGWCFDVLPHDIGGFLAAFFERLFGR